MLAQAGYSTTELLENGKSICVDVSSARATMLCLSGLFDEDLASGVLAGLGSIMSVMRITRAPYSIGTL